MDENGGGGSVRLGEASYRDISISIYIYTYIYVYLCVFTHMYL